MMLPKGWKGRATRCPVCGGKACAFHIRLKRSALHCRCCGHACRTFVWIPSAVLVIAVLCGIAGHRSTFGNLEGTLFFFELGYLLAAAVLLHLFPLRSCPEKDRAFQGTARITRVLDYSAEDVYAALSNALRRSDTYELLRRDPEELTISVYRAGYRKRWPSSAFCPPICDTLLAEPRPDGRCGLVLQVSFHDQRGVPAMEKAQELEQICRLAEEELELFHYRRISSGMFDPVAPSPAGPRRPDRYPPPPP